MIEGKTDIVDGPGLVLPDAEDEGGPCARKGPGVSGSAIGVSGDGGDRGVPSPPPCSPNMMDRGGAPSSSEDEVDGVAMARAC